jgi:hypothetical protein
MTVCHCLKVDHGDRMTGVCHTISELQLLEPGRLSPRIGESWETAEPGKVGPVTLVMVTRVFGIRASQIRKIV